jgi:light-regulated signal transduction histidine kinase (bacteriophytochrome)
MGRLIDDLLAFSRVGRTALQSAPVDHGALVADVIRQLGAAAGRVAWRIDPLPVAPGDPALLRQVWLNLLDNAVKYTGRTPAPRIEVSFRRGPAETVFHVRDNGAGFDPRYAAKLFQVFSRLHSAGEFEGTGIGLALVRRIVARHGGRTWAEGAVGEGASFFFSLPAAAAPA